MYLHERVPQCLVWRKDAKQKHTHTSLDPLETPPMQRIKPAGELQLHQQRLQVGSKTENQDGKEGRTVTCAIPIGGERLTK